MARFGNILGLFFVCAVVSGEMPLQDWQRLMSLSEAEVKQMLKNNMGGQANIPGLEAHQGSDNDVINIIPGMMNSDGCQPRNTSVKVPLSEDPSVLVIPQCVLVQKCGGCCGHDTLSCQPTNTYYSTKQIYHMVYDIDKGLMLKSVENMQFEEHRSCNCMCKVKVGDCRPDRHIYDPSSCSCRCMNDADRTTCSSKKTWSESQCACVCKNSDFCPLGEYYDPITCSCETVAGRPSVGTQTGTQANSQQCQSLSCRAGMSPVLENNSCLCRTTSSWGVQEGSLTGNQDTEERIPPRPRPRPRPMTRG
jgi:hypothetical protein